MAALAGGTTFHIDFALPVGHDLLQGFKQWQVGGRGDIVGRSAHPGLPGGLRPRAGQARGWPGRPPPLPSAWDRFSRRPQAKAARGCMDYGLHMAVTSWSDKVAADMGELTKKGAGGQLNGRAN